MDCGIPFAFRGVACDVLGPQHSLRRLLSHAGGQTGALVSYRGSIEKIEYSSVVRTSCAFPKLCQLGIRYGKGHGKERRMFGLTRILPSGDWYVGFARFLLLGWRSWRCAMFYE